MLVKTSLRKNDEFIQTRALSQLSFVQFRPYATSFPGLQVTLSLMRKSKITLGTSLDLTPSFKTSFILDYNFSFRTDFLHVDDS